MTTPVKTEPEVLRWRDQRIDWRDDPVPLADKFGWHRGHYGEMAGNKVRASISVIPFGQAGPPHSTPMEHIIFVLEGEIEFRLGPDRTPYLLSKYDNLWIPADYRYEYSNVGRKDVYLLAVASADRGPTTYWLPGEDEPRQVSGGR